MVAAMKLASMCAVLIPSVRKFYFQDGSRINVGKITGTQDGNQEGGVLRKPSDNPFRIPYEISCNILDQIWTIAIQVNTI